MVALRMVSRETTTPITTPSPAPLAWPLHTLCAQSPPLLLCSPRRVKLPLDVLCPQAAPEPLKIDLPVERQSSDALVHSWEACFDSTCTLADLAKNSLLSPPGHAEPSLDMPLGSAEHATGACRPCAWFWKQGGCRTGRFCTHCHLCPEGELKARRKAKVLSLRLGSTTPKSETNIRSPDSISPCPPGLSLFERSHNVFADGGISESETTVGTSSDGGDGSRTVSPQVTSLSPHVRVDAAVAGDVDAIFGSDACQPCAWFSRPGGCRNGAACRFVHVGSGLIPASFPSTQSSKSKNDRSVPKPKMSPMGSTRVALSLVDCV